MNSNLLRGHTEEIILNVLKSNKLYAIDIYNRIIEFSNNNLNIKKITVYKNLARMHDAGLICSIDSDNKKKKFYEITDKGLEKTKNNNIDWRNMKNILDVFNKREVKIGKHIKHFDIIDSTNIFAKDNYKFLENGDIIKANFQTKGRGRLNREWTSKKNESMMFSILLKPIYDVDNLGLLNQVISTSIIKFLQDLKIKATIKWPNDILVDGKKLCGILTEVSISNDKLNYVVIGIGVNVNNKYFYELKEKATSLFLLKNEEFNIDDLFKELLKQINYYYNDFINKGKKYKKIYNKHNFVINKLFNLNDKVYKIVGIDRYGQLIIEDEFKNQEFFHQSEITLEDLYKEK